MAVGSSSDYTFKVSNKGLGSLVSLRFLRRIAGIIVPLVPDIGGRVARAAFATPSPEIAAGHSGTGAGAAIDLCTHQLVIVAATGDRRSGRATVAVARNAELFQGLGGAHLFRKADVLLKILYGFFLRDRSFRPHCLHPMSEFIHDIVFADKRFIHQPCAKGVDPVVFERLDDKLKIPGWILWTAAGGRL